MYVIIQNIFLYQTNNLCHLYPAALILNVNIGISFYIFLDDLPLTCRFRRTLTLFCSPNCFLIISMSIMSPSRRLMYPSKPATWPSLTLLIPRVLHYTFESPYVESTTGTSAETTNTSIGNKTQYFSNNYSIILL